MRSIIRVPWLLCVFVLAACFPGIAGSGHVVTESRTVATWSKLEVHNGLTVSLGIGAPSLTVRTDDNLLGYVETYVDGDTLIVRERPNTSIFATVTEVMLTNPQLEGVEVSGGSHLVAVATPASEFRYTVSGGSHADVSGIAAGWTRLDASGGSHVTASGTTTDLVLVDSGGSHVAAAGFTATNATIGVSGGSHLDLTVSSSVAGDVSGGSQVTLYGRPANAQVSVSGGSVLRYAGD